MCLFLFAFLLCFIGPSCGLLWPLRAFWVPWKRCSGSSMGRGLLLIRERSSAGSCARPGSRAPAAPSALGWSIGAAAADPGHVRPRCRAERRAAAPARLAAFWGRRGPFGCPGSGAAAPAWPGPAPDPGEIRRGQLRPAWIEGTVSAFGPGMVYRGRCR